MIRTARTHWGTLSGSVVIACALSPNAVAAEIFALHTDHTGSVVMETDKDRNITWQGQYEPYGLPRQTAPEGPGYTGHVHDQASGLVYMQQRYYDPQIGRFLSVDPMPVNIETGINFNRFNYAANNPYNYYDPNGLDPYLVSRPLNLPVKANHNFLATGADFPGDPKATISSWGDQGDDTMGPVDEDTKGFSEGTYELDRAAWQSLSTDGSTTTYRKIDATDEAVESLAESVIAGDEYSAVPIVRGVNSNSAPGAVAQKADGGPSRVDNQRRQPGSEKSAIQRVKFKDDP